MLSSAEAIDDFESHLGEATEKFERNRGKYERVARTGRVTGDEKPARVFFATFRDAGIQRCVKFLFNLEWSHNSTATPEARA